jgi:hypothetical protein
MRKKNLNNRLTTLEQEINPDIKAMIGLVEESDESLAAARQRIINAYGYDTVPNGCTVILLNMFGKPIV